MNSNAKGDLLVNVMVYVPEQLSDAEKAAIESLKDAQRCPDAVYLTEDFLPSETYFQQREPRGIKILEMLRKREVFVSLFFFK